MKELVLANLQFFGNSTICNDTENLISFTDVKKISSVLRHKALQTKNMFLYNLLIYNENTQIFEEVLQNEELFEKINKIDTSPYIYKDGYSRSKYYSNLTINDIKSLLPVLEYNFSVHEPEIENFFKSRYYSYEEVDLLTVFLINEFVKENSLNKILGTIPTYEYHTKGNLPTKEKAAVSMIKDDLYYVFHKKFDIETAKEITKRYAFYINAILGNYHEIKISENTFALLQNEEIFEEFKKFINFFYSDNKENSLIFLETTLSFIKDISKELKDRIYNCEESKKDYVSLLFRTMFNYSGVLNEKTIQQFISFIEKMNIEDLKEVEKEIICKPLNIFKYVFKNNQDLANLAIKYLKPANETDYYTNNQLYSFSSFLTYSYGEKKKNLLKIFIELFEEYKTMDTDNDLHSLFSKKFIEKVDVNSSSVQEVKKVLLLNKSAFKSLIELGKRQEKKITVRELLFLNSADEFKLAVYHNIDLPIDEKIRKVKAIPAIDNYRNYLYIKGFAKALTKKDYSFMAKELAVLDYVLPEHVVCYFANKDKLEKYFLKNIMKIGSDIPFILDNLNVIPEDITPEKYVNFKKMYINANEDFKVFQEFVKFSDQFIFKYINNIFEFNSKGLLAICNSMFKDSVYSFEQKKNLALIVKAVIANKFEELKYSPEDFEKEIGCYISNKEKSDWIKSLTLVHKGVKAVETDDFETVINLGDKPVYSCQHYASGSYRECLLSNFDTNKKLITAYENDKYVARSILRFTQYNENLDNPSRNTSLQFKDVEEDIEAPTDSLFDSKNKKCILLERPYNASNNKKNVCEAMLNLAIEKAIEMNVDLLVNKEIFDYVDKNSFAKYNYETGRYSVYISKSKNGAQYLDSVQGSASSIKEGKMLISSTLYLFKLHKD